MSRKIVPQIIKLADVLMNTEWFLYEEHLYKAVSIDEINFNYIKCIDSEGKYKLLHICTDVEVYRQQKKSVGRPKGKKKG